MARLPRFTNPGIPQHIIQRGNNREPCFFSVEDYCRYRGDLNDAAKKNQAIIHAKTKGSKTKELKGQALHLTLM